MIKRQCSAGVLIRSERSCSAVAGGGELHVHVACMAAGGSRSHSSTAKECHGRWPQAQG